MTEKNQNLEKRGPIVAVMGHIDHGKSTLLHYIRNKSSESVPELREAGGITQHISAYEVVHTDKEKNVRTITFLDTPGHEAFSGIRKRGANVADLAILVVSAEDGVKPQTLEALESIKKSNTPFVVAINKIDKPGANIEKTKQSLAEKGVYIEGYGGDIPSVNISAKTGEGLDELLDIVMIMSELENFSGDPKKDAEGIIIESNTDNKKGISATCIIRDGVMEKGMYITSGVSTAPVRIIENFLGKQIDSAKFPSPVKIIGWDSLPEVGNDFRVWAKREEAREAVEKEITKRSEQKVENVVNLKCETSIPLVVKADTSSSLEAILGEINKLGLEKVCFEIVSASIGSIFENDVKLAGGGKKKAIVVGFNVVINPLARNLSERDEITIKTFDIIYKMSEFLKELLVENTPKEKISESTGLAKILKTFSKTKEKQIIGGKVEKGKIELGSLVKILRREAEISEGKIRELQSQKNPVNEVSEGKEFGAMIETKVEILPGDRIECFIVVEK